MKSFKKILSLMLLVVSLVLCSLIVISCGGGTNTDTSTDTGDTSKPNDKETDTSKPTDTQTGDEVDEYVTYTVYFQNQNGQPIEGVNAQICTDSSCKPPQVSDAQGVCKFYNDVKDNFKVQINSVPEGYTMIEGYIPFPEGRTSTTVTIEQNLTYSVTASDLHGNKLENVLVELYKKSDNSLVASAITDKSGKVEFVQSPDEYYAIVKHAYNNGAFTLVNDEDKVTFEKTRSVQIQFVILGTPIPYSVALKDANGEAVNDAQIKLYNSKFELVDTKSTENGVAAFTVPNGLYYVQTDAGEGKYAKTAIFEKNGATSVEISVENVNAGSDRQYPIMILGDIAISLDAGEECWYSVPFAKGKTVELISDSIEVRYVVKTIKAENGKVVFDLNEEGEATFRVTSKATEKIDVTGSIYKLGSLETPIEIEVEESYIFDIELGAGEKIYYSFTAPITGTIRVETETDFAVVSINGNRFKKSVNEGDEVIICFFTEKQNGDSLESPGATIEASLEIAQTKADYTVNVSVDNVITEGTKIEFYKYNNGEYVKLHEGISDANGKVVFADILESADYYVKAIHSDEYETTDEYFAFGDEIEITAYVTHKRDGSQRYPFLVNSEDGTNTTEVALGANAEVWYTLFYITGSTISSDNKDASVEIYTQTGDGEPVAVTTLTGEALSHMLGENYGTTTRVLVKITIKNGEAGTVNLTYTAPVVEEDQ